MGRSQPFYCGQASILSERARFLGATGNSWPAQRTQQLGFVLPDKPSVRLLLEWAAPFGHWRSSTELDSVFMQKDLFTEVRLTCASRCKSRNHSLPCMLVSCFSQPVFQWTSADGQPERGLGKPYVPAGHEVREAARQRKRGVWRTDRQIMDWRQKYRDRWTYSQKYRQLWTDDRATTGREMDVQTDGRRRTRQTNYRRLSWTTVGLPLSFPTLYQFRARIHQPLPWSYPNNTKAKQNPNQLYPGKGTGGPQKPGLTPIPPLLPKKRLPHEVTEVQQGLVRIW